MKLRYSGKVWLRSFSDSRAFWIASVRGFFLSIVSGRVCWVSIFHSNGAHAFIWRTFQNARLRHHPTSNGNTALIHVPLDRQERKRQQQDPFPDFARLELFLAAAETLVPNVDRVARLDVALVGV